MLIALPYNHLKKGGGGRLEIIRKLRLLYKSLWYWIMLNIIFCNCLPSYINNSNLESLAGYMCVVYIWLVEHLWQFLLTLRYQEQGQDCISLQYKFSYGKKKILIWHIISIYITLPRNLAQLKAQDSLQWFNSDTLKYVFKGKHLLSVETSIYLLQPDIWFSKEFSTKGRHNRKGLPLIWGKSSPL